MKKERRELLLLLVFIFMISFVSADFEKGNSSYFIESSYGPNTTLKGWINISLENELSNSIFSDSLGNSIGILELLEVNNLLAGSSYNCSTADCMADYTAEEGETTKNFELSTGSYKILGLKFNEDIVSIDSINFTVESTAVADCFNQIEVDFFNDGIVDSGNDKPSEMNCEFLKNYGCFDSEQTLNEYTIGEFPNKHCERIKLSKSPRFKLGAWVKRNGDSRELTMSLYDLYGEAIEGAQCILPDNEDSEISCDVDYLVTESEEYYVCIYSEEGAGTSKIKGYSMTSGCGFYGAGIQEESAAFQIFAEGSGFDAVGTLEISDMLSYGNSLGELTNNYLWNKYGTLNCLSNGCIVPIKITAGKSQAITLKDLEVAYETTLGPTLGDEFYELEEIPAKINSGFQKLNLDEADLMLPGEYGNITYQFSLNDSEIFSKNIVIGQVPTIDFLTPRSTASAFPTEFEVSVSSTTGNITEYTWDFGDNSTQKTNVNKINHSYVYTGEYYLTITIKDTSNKSVYKTFEIYVSSPKEMIETRLARMQQDLTNVKEQIQEFPAFYRTSLENVLQIAEVEETLKQMQRDFTAASTDEEYNEIVKVLLGFDVPRTVEITVSAENLTFYPSEDAIDSTALQELSGGSDEEDHAEAVLAWHQENIDAKMDFKELTAVYEHYEIPVLRVFEFQINEKLPLSYNSYLIIKNLQNLTFDQNYQDQKLTNHVYITLEKEQTTISFSTNSDVDFSNLPAFISPDIERLPLVEGFSFSNLRKKFKWTLFILFIFLLAIVGFIVYIILQEWYKKKYEKYLFKDRNNLYNLINYIENAKKNKIEDKEIIAQLKKAGWNSEQINYAIRKYSGQRTGMFEVPVMKILEMFKKRKKVQPQGRKMIPGNYGNMKRRPPFRGNFRRR